MPRLVGDDWKRSLESAVRVLDAIQASGHGDIALLSARQQLLYLLAIAIGHEKDDSGLEDINIGYIAVYQLDGLLSSDESQLLCAICDVVRRYLRQHGRKLKIDQR
jgi:hypothetical protein